VYEKVVAAELVVWRFRPSNTPLLSAVKKPSPSKFWGSYLPY